jgi:ATP-dependent RNA helicase RhlE
MSLAMIGLSESIMRGVHESGYVVPTEIQRKAIPHAMKGRDIIGCAPTGTGKTAAFVLPILSHLERPHHSGRHGRFPRALVLTPTRELAVQIEESVYTYGKYCGIRPIAVYGGVSIVNQLNALRKGVEIVIATPGRLLDHMERRSIDLSHVEILVLDEADRMFDMGFIHDVRRIIGYVPSERQTLLFSATISCEVKALVKSIQKNPELIEIGVPFTPVDTVTQHFYSVPQHAKTDLLIHILKKENIGSMLVFSRTKHGADRISKKLEHAGISTGTIHADRTQPQRQQALDGFKRGDTQVLVATDLAARGIDVDNISHVVNYDTPVFPEDYIHRIGRTGRAEMTGIAYTFVSSDEEKYMKKIQFLTTKRFVLQKYPGFNFIDTKERMDSMVAAAAPAIARSRKYYRTPKFW